MRAKAARRYDIGARFYILSVDFLDEIGTFHQRGCGPKRQVDASASSSKLRTEPAVQNPQHDANYAR
jgi:hypothetical protein